MRKSLDHLNNRKKFFQTLNQIKTEKLKSKKLITHFNKEGLRSRISKDIKNPMKFINSSFSTKISLKKIKRKINSFVDPRKVSTKKQ